MRDDRGLIKSLAGTTVLVLGDVMLDEYVWGEVRRISQEAPVPIVEASRRTYAAGGAGNVAVNVVGLGGIALLGGVVGSDYSAGKLCGVLTECGVLTNGLATEALRPTTTKTRIVAHSQQVVRVDSEMRDPLTAELEAELLAWVEKALPTVGACVLSDYNKGVVSPGLAQAFISLARQHRKPVIVDPKGTDYAKYRGATVITPNLHEVERVVNRELRNEDEIQMAAAQLSEMLSGGAVLITRGPQGMSLFTSASAPAHIPTVALAVYDVTGAGDTVVSTLALGLAVGASLEDAACLANRAAGIVVGKLGTSRVSAEELLAHSTE